MGYYKDGNYQIVEEHEFGLGTFIFTHIEFLLSKWFSARHIKNDVLEEFRTILDEKVKEKPRTLSNPNKNEYERLRLQFNETCSVFIYYLNLTNNYQLSERDKIENTIQRLCDDIDLNYNAYFRKKLIQDYFNNLEENISQYLFLENYRRTLESFEINTETEKLDKKTLKPEMEENHYQKEIVDENLKDMINDDKIYDILITGLIEINFLNQNGALIMPNKRLYSDLSIIFIKFNDLKIIDLNRLSGKNITRVIKNTFGEAPSSTNFNKIKNKVLHLPSDIETKSNDRDFYKKLSFLDTKAI